MTRQRLFVVLCIWFMSFHYYIHDEKILCSSIISKVYTVHYRVWLSAFEFNTSRLSTHAYMRHKGRMVNGRSDRRIEGFIQKGKMSQKIHKAHKQHNHIKFCQLTHTFRACCSSVHTKLKGLKINQSKKNDIKTNANAR